MLKIKDGCFCEHGKMLLYCPECYPIWQEEENRRWIEKQNAIIECVKHYNTVTEPLYYSICGNPIEPEKYY